VIERHGESASEGLALERIVFFSDAVIAIAITLLAIDLRVPDLSDLNDQQFVQQLLDLAPHYLAFVFSFGVIALYWLAHHRMFRFIVRWDGGLLTLNLLFLFFVVQVPLLSSVLGSYGYLASATIVYAAGLALMGFASVGLWIYALRHRLVDEGTPADFVRFRTFRGFAAPVVFVISIPIALFSPQLAQVSWLLVTVVTMVWRGPEGASPRPER
jgi:uncharacterized membrane protein